MSLVRDPAFWRRFSTAVHLDEESKAPVYATTTSISSASSTSSRPDLKHQDSWLARQEAKKRRRACICWAFWLGFAGFVAGVVVVVLWLKTSGVLDRLMNHVEGMVDPSASASASSTGAVPMPTPTGGNGKRAIEGVVAYVYMG
ncbi:MAG: hypothetical protein M1821_001980 [Bathelium mastoideum]|nr:MAG: hypothetical protein M1821_001980 [Bathelium mastoideum]